MKKEVLHKLGWMQQFRFTEYESTYIKTALIRNGSDIGYMSPSFDLFWASRDAIVLVEDKPSSFSSKEEKK